MLKHFFLNSQLGRPTSLETEFVWHKFGGARRKKIRTQKKQNNTKEILPCAVYLNGQYWGVYDLREKVDDHDFTDYYYDYSPSYNRIF